MNIEQIPKAPNRLSVPAAAEAKSCTRQTIRNAIGRKEIDAERVGRMIAVIVNARWKRWQPVNCGRRLSES